MHFNSLNELALSILKTFVKIKNWTKRLLAFKYVFPIVNSKK